MFRLYLESSSIHGLRYLSESKGKLPKMLWLVFIAASFMAAFYIIYNNVKQWENSPSVITTVKPIEIEVNAVSFLQ